MSPTAMRPAAPSPNPREVLHRLDVLRAGLLESESRIPLEAFGASRESARNLLHYLALRRFDLGDLQSELADLGLSSLGRAEGHVLHNIDAVRNHLSAMEARKLPDALATRSLGPMEGREVLADRTRRLLGSSGTVRDTRIMVTVPCEASGEPSLVRELIRSGMDVMRINCAHDSEREWSQMILHCRRAQRALGRRCRVELDLSGPRLRTGPLLPEPAVLKVRPKRDRFGRVVGPAKVRLVADLGDSQHPPEEPCLPLPGAWLHRRRVAERIRFTDARGARRSLQIVSQGPGASWQAELGKTAYVTNGTRLLGRARGGRPDAAAVTGLRPTPGRIRLSVGDELLLSPSPEPGRDRAVAGARRIARPRIGVSLPQVLPLLHPGDQVWFDGGRIGGHVASRSSAGVVVKVARAPPGGTWLRADQGLNLPDTDLGLSSLSAEDRHALRFAVEHADLVGYSFVQSAEDVRKLREELRQLGRPRMGVVLKIETRRAFDRLPEILLSALQGGPTGVMVARGDLAVEVGFERLAEVQEEILWLCEAAHIPAIWATQVLEGLAKGGMPSRAEVTDAAMGERAECVMLNKGPYLVEAVQALDSILRRMQAHQVKKSARLRHLAVAERYLQDLGKRSAVGLTGGTRPKGSGAKTKG